MNAALHGTAAGVSAPVVSAIAAVLVSAWLYHVIRDHHGHLRLASKIWPAVTVPETRHSSRWHRMSHPRRFAVDLMLTAAAALAGVAWELAPLLVTVIAVLAALVVFVAGVVRAAAGRWPASLPAPRREEDKP